MDIKRLEKKVLNRVNVPTYFKKYINSEIDLTASPSICCPFHAEDTPSFSYKESSDIWRCWGKCHVGGNVIKLHQKNNNMLSYEEAILSLAAIYKITDDTTDVEMLEEIMTTKEEEDDLEVELKVLLSSCERILSNKDKCLLDDIMSYDIPIKELYKELETFAKSKGVMLC